MTARTQLPLHVLKNKAAAWNANHAVGEAVVYRKDDGSYVETTTRTQASVLGEHSVVVWLKGIAGCVDLERVGPLLRDGACAQ